MARQGDKKERLLTAAKNLIHQKGYRTTTLADIARESDVPLGNIYYYFKTKDEIAAAVIEARLEDFHDWAARCENDPDPRRRLICILDMPITNRDDVALHGCPFGSLAQELCKVDSTLANQARQLLQTQVEWVTGQFKALGKKDPLGHALQFIATVQGISMLASALNDSRLITRQIEVLKASVENL